MKIINELFYSFLYYVFKIQCVFYSTCDTHSNISRVQEPQVARSDHTGWCNSGACTTVFPGGCRGGKRQVLANRNYHL